MNHGHGGHRLGGHRGDAHGMIMVDRCWLLVVGCWSSFDGCWLSNVAQVAITATKMAMMNITHYTNITAENVIDIWATFSFVTKKFNCK